MPERNEDRPEATTRGKELNSSGVRHVVEGVLEEHLSTMGIGKDLVSLAVVEDEQAEKGVVVLELTVKSPISEMITQSQRFAFVDTFALRNQLDSLLAKELLGVKAFLVTTFTDNEMSMVFEVVESEAGEVVVETEAKSTPIEYEPLEIQSAAFLMEMAVVAFLERKFVDGAITTITPNKLVAGIEGEVFFDIHMEVGAANSFQDALANVLDKEQRELLDLVRGSMILTGFEAFLDERCSLTSEESGHLLTIGIRKVENSQALLEKKRQWLVMILKDFVETQ
jgi:hypothetical protein